ncbi:unnamed protein product [Paramecium primaurelia]|uniref:Uncharacterized protein n=1 Tax=Paramecium primaurelia TaxID=5886 RepID=A0A8S1M9T4_PARPR|nr:unnamed protein product [Paramecium primaurelia]
MQNKNYLSELNTNKEIVIQAKQIYYNCQQVMSYKKTTINLKLSDQGEVLHLKDGEILKREVISNQNEMETILNLEQLKHLRWEGQYGKQNQKIGKWTPVWNENVLEAGGNYNDFGQKEGIWVDLHENYWEGQQITYRGEYQIGKKVGNWKIEIKSMMSDPKIIGGGQYKENTGEKIGMWKELNEDFDQCSQIVQAGEYRNGKKIGQWTIMNLDNDKTIGGGNYDEENGFKIGNWIEPHNKFNEESFCEIKFVGQYNNGKKIGIWEIQVESAGRKNLKIIALNNYDQESGQEIGKQTELFENFSNSCQIIYHGEYKNGKKTGYWQTLSIDSNTEIGGGKYDEETGLKNGQWIEIHENFDRHLPIGYYGSYKNGMKIGKWVTKYFELNTVMQSDQDIIGSGNYDEENGLKNGDWLELDENFWRGCQVKYVGKYKNGKKYGSWDTLHQRQKDEVKIGGGSYDEATGLKTGVWVELYEHFYRNIPIVFRGEYKNGVKQEPFNQEDLNFI